LTFNRQTDYLCEAKIGDRCYESVEKYSL